VDKVRTVLFRLLATMPDRCTGLEPGPPVIPPI